MAAQRRPKSEAPSQSPKSEPVLPTGSIVVSTGADAAGLGPVASPARQLQRRLQRQYNPMVREFSSRFVTLMVSLTCLGTWVAGSGAYSTF